MARGGSIGMARKAHGSMTDMKQIAVEDWHRGVGLRFRIGVTEQGCGLWGEGCH